MRPYFPRMRRDLDVVSRGNSRGALVPWAPANQQSTGGIGVSTPCGCGIVPGDPPFISRVVAVVQYIFGRISVLEMRPHPPRVWRDLDVVPRGSSRPALAPRAAANQQPASGFGVSTPCGAVSTPGITVFVHRLSELGVVDICKDF